LQEASELYGGGQRCSFEDASSRFGRALSLSADFVELCVLTAEV
jgi:hypothetical protein